MTDKKKEELRKAICASYPGVSEAEISFMISFFDMMQAKANGFSSAKGGGKTEAKGGGESEAKGNGKTEAKGGGGSEAKGGGKTEAKGNGKTTDEGGIKTKANRLVDSGRPSKTYILYISIEQCPVKVFRRLRVPSNLWLGNLSEMLIPAVGWAGYHLSQYTQGNVDYTSKSNIDENERLGFDFNHRQIDEMSVTVEDVLPLKGSKIIWEYDFGDSWIHNIKVTSISDEPCAAEDIQVTSGKGACPPEDVGGVWGYARMLDVLSGKVDDPEEKASFEEWLGLEKGERFDPDEFDPSIANEDIEDLVKLIEEGKDDF